MTDPRIEVVARAIQGTTPKCYPVSTAALWNMARAAVAALDAMSGAEADAARKSVTDGEVARVVADIQLRSDAGILAGRIQTARAMRKAASLIERQAREVTRLRTAVSKSNDDIGQTLGRALGYPKFCDDQQNFPGATEANGVCVGDHVAESIAVEAARRIEDQALEIAALRGKEKRG